MASQVRSRITITEPLIVLGRNSSWILLVLACAACSERTLAPDDSIGPSFDKGGIPGWRKCFDAGATPVLFGTPWPLTGGGAGALAVEQIEVVKFEINNTCGVRVAAGDVGSPLTSAVRDVQASAAVSAAVTQQLLALGAVAIVGAGASVTGPPAAQVAVDADVPFGSNQSAADAMSGCTAAELADPTVIKSATPVWAPGRCWHHRGLVFRTTTTGFSWGTMGATYARTTYPALTRAAIIFRDDDFGQPNRDALRAQFVALGGTVLAEAGHLPAVTLAQLKTQLMTVTAGNPSVILGSIAAARLQLLMQAYVELRDDPTWTTRPTDFNTLKFIWTSTLSGVNYSVLPANALAALVNQNEFVQTAMDPASPAFQAWFATYRAYNPNAQEPASAFIPGAYDAAIVMALAMTAAGTTNGPAVAAKIREVSNPPGVVVCPGQYRKAFRLLAKGKDINYEGALGPIDIDERGNATGLAFGIFRVQPDGSSAQVANFGFPPHPVCDDDEEGDLDG
jgi:ABC-type branched-subunit amino acid transport system substrate-binding protein